LVKVIKEDELLRITGVDEIVRTGGIDVLERVNAGLNGIALLFSIIAKVLGYRSFFG